MVRAIEAPVIAGTPHGKDVLVAHLSDVVIYPRRLPVACKLPCPGGLLSGLLCCSLCTVLQKCAQTQPCSNRSRVLQSLKDCAAAAAAAAVVIVVVWD